MKNKKIKKNNNTSKSINNNEEKKKSVIGLYGEMNLAMELHDRGWQVHRAYIDDGIDFVITKYYCKKCKKYSDRWIRYTLYKGKKGETKNAKCVTNLCSICKKNELDLKSKFLQVKASEGVPTKNENIRKFSFHANIGYNTGKNVYYVWIAVFTINEIKKCYYYIFNSKDVSKFDDIKLDVYQKTDNQKTTLRIDSTGNVLNNGKKYSYNVFNDTFLNNWDCLE